MPGPKRQWGGHREGAGRKNPGTDRQRVVCMIDLVNLHYLDGLRTPSPKWINRSDVLNAVISEARAAPEPARNTRTTASSSELAELKAECAKLRSENTTLKRRLVERAEESEGNQGQLKRAPQHEFGEVAKLRAQIAALKSDILKLKAQLQEEPDVAKLRKKVIDQQAQMASLRRAMKGIAKERDDYQYRAGKPFKEARAYLTGSNYRVLIKALHSDRSRQVSSEELKEAERLAVALRPLFIEKS
jgi:hypothetical protein